MIVEEYRIAGPITLDLRLCQSTVTVKSWEQLASEAASQGQEDKALLKAQPETDLPTQRLGSETTRLNLAPNVRLTVSGSGWEDKWFLVNCEGNVLYVEDIRKAGKDLTIEIIVPNAVKELRLTHKYGNLQALGVTFDQVTVNIENTWVADIVTRDLQVTNDGGAVQARLLGGNLIVSSSGYGDTPAVFVQGEFNNIFLDIRGGKVRTQGVCHGDYLLSPESEDGADRHFGAIQGRVGRTGKDGKVRTASPRFN